MKGENWGDFIASRKRKFSTRRKKLAKHYEARKMLEKILLHIKETLSYEDLSLNPISKMYGFEALKHEMSGFYSFNLCKNGGTIRLICQIDVRKNTVRLLYISMNHYIDFKNSLKNKVKM